MITIALRIAAEMLNNSDDASFEKTPDINLINPLLAMEINTVDQMVKLTGGILVSRQSIAQIIHQWKKENPDKTPYK
jgi:hypothetical protein